MKFQIRTMALIALVAAAGSVCFAQTEGFRISASSPRPLTDLIDQLNSRYGWSITYEDAPLVASDDLIDITSPTYVGPGRAYTFFAKPISVQTSLPDPTVLSRQEEADGLSVRALQKETLEMVLTEYEQSGNHGSFKMVQNGRYIHVFPDRFRGEGGAYKPFESMLSTRVSIPNGNYRMDQLIWLVCDQVAQKRGLPIVHGTAPVGMLMAITLHESAYNERARDVLVNAFEDSKAVRASHGAYDVRYFRWALLYDPSIRAYGLNIGWSSKDLPGTPSSAQNKANQSSGDQGSGSKYSQKAQPGPK